MANHVTIQDPEILQKWFIDIYHEIGELLQQLEQVIEEEQSTDLKKLSDALKGILNRCRRKWEHPHFQVAVLGPDRSGKSTLINAWVGREVLIRSEFTDTPNIVRVRDHPSIRQKTLKRQRNINDDQVHEASLFRLTNLLRKEPGFDILDVPMVKMDGVNKNEIDVFLYLLDYTNLQAETEMQQLFDILMGINIKPREQFIERLFIIVNKIDRYSRHTFPDPDDVSKYVSDYFNYFDFRISPEQILIVSSEHALVARLVISKQPSPRAIKDFDRAVYGIKTKVISQEARGVDAIQVIEESGFRQLEEKVLSFVYTKSASTFFKDLLYEIDQDLKILHNKLALQIDSTSPANNTDNTLKMLDKLIERVKHCWSLFPQHISVNEKQMRQSEGECFINVDSVMEEKNKIAPLTENYNLVQIRLLLTNGFTGEQLRTFCFDHSDFRAVYQNLNENAGKRQIVQGILEHADQTLRMKSSSTGPRK